MNEAYEKIRRIYEAVVQTLYDQRKENGEDPHLEYIAFSCLKDQTNLYLKRNMEYPDYCDLLDAADEFSYEMINQPVPKKSDSSLLGVEVQ